MLPRKCLTSCEVPYLCSIACPLNERLDELVPKPKPIVNLPIEENEPLNIVIANDQEPSQNDRSKP
jgi:hypothetical protein